MKLFLRILLLIVMLAPAYINAQWAKISSLTVNSVNDVIVDKGIFYVSTTNSGFYRSTDGTATWQAINNSLTGDGLRGNYITKIDDALWGSTVNGPYKSTNNGDTWKRKINGMVIGGSANNYFINAIAKINDVYYTSTHGSMYRSTDAGESWTATDVVIQGPELKCFALVDGNIFAGRDNINNPILYKSTNNGLNWTGVPVWNNMPIGVICMYNEPGKFFLGTGHGMWLSTNSGMNWVMRNEGLGLDPYLSSMVKVGNTIVGTLTFGGGGVYKTTNDGLNWTEITDNFPFASFTDKILVHNNNFYVASSAGLWKRPVSDVITSTEIGNSSIPGEYSLLQNYPNPFNPSTNISYSLPKPGMVSIKIFDISGKEINTLVNEIQTAGNYSVTFDGSGLASGVYYYELKAGDFTNIKTMVLVK